LNGDPYIPDRGDILWLDFGKSAESDDTYGHEQQKRRPAFCVSAAVFNGARGLAIVCPITSQIKDFPTLVPLPEGLLPKPSAVMVDQVRSVDWKARGGQFEARSPYMTTALVLEKLGVLIGN
jgi:mRNA interferase MazF